MERTVIISRNPDDISYGISIGFAINMTHNVAVPITAVSPGGPSARAGLQRGDRISAINGTPLTRFDEVSLRNLLENRQVCRIALTILPQAPPTVAQAEEASEAETSIAQPAVIEDLQKANQEEELAQKFEPAGHMESPLGEEDAEQQLPKVTRRERRHWTPERGFSSPAASAAGPTSPRIQLKRGYSRPPSQTAQHQFQEHLSPPWTPGSAQSSPAKTQSASPSTSPFSRLSLGSGGGGGGGDDSSVSLSPSPNYNVINYNNSYNNPAGAMRERAATSGWPAASASPVPVFLFSSAADSTNTAARPLSNSSSQCESPSPSPSPSSGHRYKSRLFNSPGESPIDATVSSSKLKQRVSLKKITSLWASLPEKYGQSPSRGGGGGESSHRPGRLSRAACSLGIVGGGSRRAHSVDALDGPATPPGSGGGSGVGAAVVGSASPPVSLTPGKLSTASSLDLESAVFTVTVERLANCGETANAKAAPSAPTTPASSGTAGAYTIEAWIRIDRDASLTILPVSDNYGSSPQQQQQQLTIAIGRECGTSYKRRKLRLTTPDWQLVFRHDEDRYLRALQERLAAFPTPLTPSRAHHHHQQQQQHFTRRSRLQQQRMLNSASVDETGGSGGGSGGGGGGGSPRPFKLGLLRNLRTNRLWPGSPPPPGRSATASSGASAAAAAATVATASNKVGSYGIPLHLCPMGTDGVPLLVQLCCRVLEATGLRREGLYRVSGNARNIDALEAELSKPPGEMDPACELWLEHNVVANVLKRFLLQLPDPLIPAVYYNDFVSAQQLHEHSGRMLKLHRLLSMMEEHSEHPQHKCHRRTLQYLVGHLAKVAKLSASNRMRVYNLAMVFAPSLFGQRAQETLVSDSAHLIGLTKSIIVYRDWLFADWQTADLSVPTQLADQELDVDPSSAASVEEPDNGAAASFEASSPPPPPPPSQPLDVEDEHRLILSIVRGILADWRLSIQPRQESASAAASTTAASSNEASPVHSAYPSGGGVVGGRSGGSGGGSVAGGSSAASLRRCASLSDEATTGVAAAAAAAAVAAAGAAPQSAEPPP